MNNMFYRFRLKICTEIEKISQDWFGPDIWPEIEKISQLDLSTWLIGMKYFSGVFEIGVFSFYAEIFFLLVSCMQEVLQEEPHGNLTILLSLHFTSNSERLFWFFLFACQILNFSFQSCVFVRLSPYEVQNNKRTH